LRILKATYGSSDHALDVTERLQGLVKNGHLFLTVSNSLFSDPCPGRFKTLRFAFDLPGGNQFYFHEVEEHRIVLAPTVGTKLAPESSAAARYLDLLKQCLTRMIFHDLDPSVDPAQREEGHDWPKEGETMVGLRRLDNVQQCIEDILRSKVPGDLLEAGVWRGGTTILMRAALEAYGDRGRRVWVADSFEGVPKPNAALYPMDQHDALWTFQELAIPLEQVARNFARYGLLDDRVRFLKGWFKDTLPHAPIAQLAVLRLDGDLYESTMDVLRPLYPKLSAGGYAIIDDYKLIPQVRQAVDEYRGEQGITEPLQDVDWNAVYWQRAR